VVSTVSLQGQKIVTDRPDQTEASSTIPLSSLQIESGILIQHNGPAIRQALLPTNLFRFGLSHIFEIRLQHEYVQQKFGDKSTTGFSDLQVGFKLQLLRKENINTEIAFLSHLVLPSGTENLSNNSYGTVNKLCISHTLNDRMSLGYNLGYDYIGFSTLRYSAALGYSINDKAGLYIESYGSYEDFDTHVTNFDAGVTYLLADNMQLDFSFGSGLNTDMNYIAIGISWNIPSNK
jgi:hypothetical protein